MKNLLIISLLLSACSGESEPDWMFDVQMCEAEGGFATVEDMGNHTEVMCDYSGKESACYAICKPYGDCPQIECDDPIEVENNEYI